MARLDICSGVSAFEYKDTLRKLQVYHLLGELLGVKGGSNVFRSDRISSVYIVGWLVGHTFSKLVILEC